jgi:ligand-binding sensor domain-containing protein/signal transduction histidine kinase
MTPRVLLVAASLVLAATALPALDPAVPLSQYGHDAWTSDSGLPQNSITTILQTRDGYIWLGTQEGLVRFDGVRFTVFDTRNTKALSDDWVQALLQTRDGTLWIGTVAGLVSMKDGAFSPRFPDRLSHAAVEALFEGRDGSVWVGSELGASRIVDGRITTFSRPDGLPAPRVRAIAEDARGALWVGGNWGLARREGGRFQPRSFPGGPAALGVLSLLPDGAGDMWAGTLRGLAHVESSGVRLYGEAEGLSGSAIKALNRDRDGNLWIGTDRGLFRFRDGRFLRHGTPEGLSSNRILAIHEDREGSLWVGTSDGGLNRIKRQRIAIYTARDGLSDDALWTVFEDRRGNLWAGTADGVVNRLAPGQSRFEPWVRLPASVMAIAEDRDGSLWFGTYGAGLAHLRGRRVTRYTQAQGLSGNWISSVLVDRRGAVWAATAGSGINRLERGAFVNYRTPDGLGSDAIFSLFEDREGSLWVGTRGGGVSQLRDGVFRTFTTRDGLAHDVVMSTYQDSEGTYWFATRGGLCRYRDGRFTTYRQKEGLFHDAAQRVLEDGRGYLWLTSNRGVFRVSVAELAAAGQAAGRIADHVTFTTATGMIRAECNNAQHGAWRGRDGRLWFATVKGLAMADPSRIELNPVAPPVVIEEIFADGQALSASDSLRLAPGSRKLEFDYTALSFLNPLAVRFRYRLEGFEKEWVDAGPRRAAFYTNLPPGRYRFRVGAANEDGVWNEAGAAIDLVLERHLFETTWFRCMAILAAGAAAALGYRLRVRRLEARERLRTALVEAQLDALQFQLRPHFLFNTLNSILPLVGKDPERARQMVVRLGELLRLSLKSEQTPQVTLAEEVAILEKYLSIEKVRFRDRLEVSISLPPEVASASVPSFLLQPLVENAIKHGLAGKAERGRIAITASAEDGCLLISVLDNGPGLKESGPEETAGIGLRNTRRRLEALHPGNHSLELSTVATGGCEVRIRLPLVLAQIPLRPASAEAPAVSRVARAS